MGCVLRNDNGVVQSVTVDNGLASVLYDDLNNLPFLKSREQALQYYALSKTKSFNKKFVTDENGEPKLMFKNLSDYNPTFAEGGVYDNFFKALANDVNRKGVAFGFQQANGTFVKLDVFERDIVANSKDGFLNNLVDLNVPMDVAETEEVVNIDHFPTSSGITVQASVGNRRIGGLRLTPFEDGYKADQIVIYDEYQGFGIGTELLRYAVSDLNETVYSDGISTVASKKVLDNLVNEGLLVEQDGLYVSNKYVDKLEYVEVYEPDVNYSSVLFDEQGVKKVKKKESFDISELVNMSNPRFKTLFKHYAETDGKINMYGGRGDNEGIAFFRHSDKMIALNVNHSKFDLYKNNEFLDRTIAHEIIHSEIYKSLENRPDDRVAFDTELDNLRKIMNDNVSEDLSETLRNKIDYINAGSPEELLTYALTDQEVAVFLDSILLDTSVTKIDTVWNRLKRAILDVIEFITGDSVTLFDNAVDVLNRYTGDFRGNSLFYKPNTQVQRIAKEYVTEKNIGLSNIAPINKLNTDRSQRISKIYDEAIHNPYDPEVKEAYEKMVEETIWQYEKMMAEGYSVEIYQGQGEPYATSKELVEDVLNNKRMVIFGTESGYGSDGITQAQRDENPLLTETKFKDVNGQPMLANDLFRAVHDFFGHAEYGNGFGALGEENAWRVHSRMFSPLARRAMTTETRGQNSYVNFSGVNDAAKEQLKEANKLRKEGKIDEANALKEQALEQFSFADQKITLLPEWVTTEMESSLPNSANNVKQNIVNNDIVSAEVGESVIVSEVRPLVPLQKLMLDPVVEKEIDFSKVLQTVSLDVPISQIEEPLKELNAMGMTSYIVGGGVRDILMGISPKDIDIEVHGIDFKDLMKVLSKYGSVTEVLVGEKESFSGIITFNPEGGSILGEPYEFSVPRIEKSTGDTKQDFEIVSGSAIKKKEAFLRRENTINAIGYDPIKKELYNPFNGLQDLKNKRMDLIDEEKFKEDPSRIVRALQFQARFGFTPTERLTRVMREMVESGVVDTVPNELWGKNFDKLMMKGVDFYQMFDFMRDTGIGDRYFPDLMKLRETAQEPAWHPEGDVEEHTKQVVQKAYEIAERENLEGNDRKVLMYAALLHDIAKPQTTKVIDGKITARGHEKSGVEPARKLMQFLRLPKIVENRVAAIVQEHLAHASIHSITSLSGKKRAFNKLNNRLKDSQFNQKGQISDLLYLMEADMLGRNNAHKQAPESLFEFYWLYENMGEEKSKVFVNGKDLINDFGFEGGKRLGMFLKKQLAMIDADLINNKEEALDWIQERLEKEDIEEYVTPEIERVIETGIPENFEPSNSGLKRIDVNLKLESLLETGEVQRICKI